MADAENEGSVRRAEVGGEFRVCPNCGYEHGFHSMFRPSGTAGVLDWFFICPNCGTRYDIGLTVTREGS